MKRASSENGGTEEEKEKNEDSAPGGSSSHTENSSSERSNVRPKLLSNYIKVPNAVASSQSNLRGSEGIIRFHSEFNPNRTLINDGTTSFHFTQLRPRAKLQNEPREQQAQSSVPPTPNSFQASSNSAFGVPLLFPQNKANGKTEIPRVQIGKPGLTSMPLGRQKPAVVPSIRQPSAQGRPAGNTASNRTSGLLSENPADDSGSDTGQSFPVRQFTSCDPLLLSSSPVSSPLFTDNTTVFPFSDYIVDSDAGYIDQLVSYGGSLAFNSIRADNQCARTESIQNLLASSPRLSAARISGTGALNENSHSATSNREFNVINFGAKKRVVTCKSSEDPLVGEIPSGASAVTAETPKEPKLTKNGVNLLKSAHGKGPLSLLPRKLPSVDGENPLKRPRSGSGGGKSSEKDPLSDLRPPPHGGIKRAGPYLLGKLPGHKLNSALFL